MLETDSNYLAQIRVERTLKDKQFAMSPRSPFADAEPDFSGLRYFEPDGEWNVKATLIQPDTTFVREITDSKGGIRYYIYSGELNFKILGKNLSLPVWKDKDETGVLFIMFRDKTNGVETYEGGRYIEMPWPESWDNFTLDFNRCFNPYCHYNHNYSCPVIPRDLTLPVRVEAGEKKYVN